MKLMSFFRSLITMIFRRDRVESEMDEELRLHIENRADDLERSGLPRAEAMRRARIEFGGQERFKEEIRDELGGQWLETLWTDVRYGLRMLRKTPGFASVAILTLALGIGANTAIFTLMNGLMLHTLPVRDPGRLIEILHHYPGEPEPGFNGVSWDAYQTMRDANRVLSDLIIGSLNVYVLSGHGFDSQTVFGGNVGGTFFESLGIKPAIGRLIIPQDIADSSPVAVVSWSFWKSRFNLDPAIVGQKIINDDKPLTIIGVTQREFYGLSNQAKQDIWVPYSLGGPPSSESPVGLYGHLKPGVSIQQARANLATLFQGSQRPPRRQSFYASKRTPHCAGGKRHFDACYSDALDAGNRLDGHRWPAAPARVRKSRGAPDGSRSIAPARNGRARVTRSGPGPLAAPNAYRIADAVGSRRRDRYFPGLRGNWCDGAGVCFRQAHHGFAGAI